MTFKEDIAADAGTFYDTDEFGVQVTYNGAGIVAVIESGSEQTAQSVASKTLMVRVQQAEVSEPAVDDKVVYDGRTYRVGEGSYLDGADWVLTLIPDHIDYVEV